MNRHAAVLVAALRLTAGSLQFQNEQSNSEIRNALQKSRIAMRGAASKANSELQGVD
jgi:hypothetical protein